jgi:hypothetical protein
MPRKRSDRVSARPLRSNPWRALKRLQRRNASRIHSGNAAAGDLDRRCHSLAGHCYAAPPRFTATVCAEVDQLRPQRAPRECL